MAGRKGKGSAKKTKRSTEKAKAPTVKQLREQAKALGLKGYSKLKHQQLVDAIADAEAETDTGDGNSLGARLRAENAARAALADAALAERDAETDETAKKTREPEGGWAEPWMATFIDHLANGGTVSKACELAVVGRATAYRHRQGDEDFALAWADAEQESTERLEEEAYRRAFHGVRKPVHYQGLVVDFVAEYSDTMIIFLLKARKPDTYRERFDHRHSGGVARPTLPGGGTLDLSKLEQEEIDKLERLLEKAAVTEEA
jgi:hypothetical protein